MKTLRDIFIGLILGGAFAFGGMWLYGWYKQYQEEKTLEIQMKEEARKAHRDSLMHIREAQEREAREENEKEIQQRVAVRFITDFYQKAFFDDDHTPVSCRSYLTPSCQQKLKDACPDGDGLAWWLFRDNSQDSDLESMQRHFRVTPEPDGWYRVHLVQQGATEFRHVKVVLQGGKMLIDDVR
jgi:hypothetical protein